MPSINNERRYQLTADMRCGHLCSYANTKLSYSEIQLKAQCHSLEVSDIQ